MFNNNYTGKPTRGLVASYPLDGNANASVGTNSTATNVTWVKTNKGYQNQAGMFLSTSAVDGITLPIISTGEYSISGWFNPSVTAISGDYNIAFRWSTGNTNEEPIYFYYGGYGNNSYRVSIQNTANSYFGNTYSKTFSANTWYHIIVTVGGGNVKIYFNNVLEQTFTYTGTAYTRTTGFCIGNRTYNKNEGWDGLIQNVDIYNVALTEDEIRNLYLEGQRQLGVYSSPSYPNLLSGLVGYFRAEDIGGTALYNLVNGITATRVGGTNTADNLGNNQAILNPNYTWSSLTYTTGYTFENSGSGWNIVTSPTGLSATGINRTTTLRDVFLFNRTLTANEVVQLQDLCNKEIIYPSKVYDLPNLRDGLVLEYNGSNNLTTTIYDTSGNGKNGTVSSTPTYKRQGRVKTISLSSQSISWEGTSFTTSMCFEKVSGVWTLVVNPAYITSTGITSGTREITGIRLYNRTVTTTEQQQYFYSKKANFIY